MAGIKRFITYIYAYENGTKGINAGFAKVEIRGNECRIEVHLRGTPIRMGMDQVYLFKVEGGQMLAFPMGEMRMIKGSGDYGTIIKADQIGGSEYSFAEMDGMVFAGEAGSISWASDVFTITLHNIPEGVTWWIRSIQSTAQQALETFDLEEIDLIRDEILTKPGNTAYELGNVTTNLKLKKMFGERGINSKLKSTRPQYGLLLRTYNSDLYQNWINTEWIEGANGINEISAVDVSDGTLSMDALNLAQKVYNMLNRIAVSGGTYRDWLETVYASGQYLERCETPTFEGGTSQEIVFQEVVSNSATEDEPLGTLAGRGINAGKQKGGKIKIRATEPGYIMSITSITPRIDYSQGNDFDTDWTTIDDMHKPALDGIGYQDSVNTGRAWWDDTYAGTVGTLIKHAAGKTVAWIDYMTNVNKTYGNFASGMSEAFMVLNRNYQMKVGTKGETLIDDLTTYIDPVKYNYIFADTSIDAMNFWLQIKYEITARRLMSAKQIPNL